MYEPRNQRRTLTTRLLKESLIRLLKEKEIQKISITELCREAGINRTTFYSHYGSQYDVLKDIENTMIQDIQAIIGEYRADDDQHLIKIMESICDYLKDNMDVAKIVLDYNGIESEFAATLFHLPEACHLTDVRLPEGCDEIDRELLQTCFAGGGYSLIRRWLVRDLPKSSHEIAELIYEVAAKGWLSHRKGK